MLQSRNLDDQSFEEIMEFIMGRLPWLCPAWTDYNEHDPGITILELMAWYKEMQQYHLNTVTDDMRKKLLKLVGVAPAPPSPARLMIELNEGAGEYMALSRLESAQEIPFELTAPAMQTAKIEGLAIVGERGVYDAMDALGNRGVAVWPFGDGEGPDTELLIRLSGAKGSVRLYFDIDDACEVPRNPFARAEQAPRRLEWSVVGAGPVAVADETHALSVSGYVTVELGGDMPLTDCGLGLKEGRYLRVRETDHGCEERVRLKYVSASRFEAVQRETLASLGAFCVQGGECSLALDNALSIQGAALVFVREEKGLRAAEAAVEYAEAGATLRFDATGCALDGEPNAFVVSLDPIRGEELMFDSTGLPNMRIDLPLGGRRALTGGMALLCDAVHEDGVIRPALWRYVDDLSVCGPRDRVFAFDAAREQLVLGDGEHGMIVPRGERAILAARLEVSCCSGGNVPQNCGLTFPDGTEVKNTAAVGGAEAESPGEAARAFLYRFKDTVKCASAADYEAAARATPGLRVAAAKAIPMFDSDQPGGKTAIPTVTVVAAPYSGRQRPLPDERFLREMRAHLNALRPVCTVVKVVAPRYVPVEVTVQARAARGAEAAIRAAVEGYFAVGGARNIGEDVSRDDIMALITRLDGVIKLERLELRPLGQSCYAGARGDLIVNKDAVAYPARINVAVK